MQGHRRRRATQRSPATSISPKGGGGTASISLSLLLHDAQWHRVVVALATNITVFMERDTKFLADIMLGSLAKWLRILGYDTAYDNQIEDDEIIERCRREDRVALTRDRRLTQRFRLRGCLLIEREELFEQIREVLEAIGHEIELNRLLSRCLECNSLLQSVDKKGIRLQVPAYVFQSQSHFKRCPGCRRIYWGGTHRRNIYQRLKTRL